jgi:hypothetical protein
MRITCRSVLLPFAPFCPLSCSRAEFIADVKLAVGDSVMSRRKLLEQWRLNENLPKTDQEVLEMILCSGF